MKKLLPLLILPLLFACSNQGDQGDQKMETGQTDKKLTAAMLDVKTDLVCGMNMEQIPVADTMTYKGKVYGFCNKECKEEFAENPEKYLTAENAQ